MTRATLEFVFVLECKLLTQITFCIFLVSMTDYALQNCCKVIFNQKKTKHSGRVGKNHDFLKNTVTGLDKIMTSTRAVVWSYVACLYACRVHDCRV